MEHSDLDLCSYVRAQVQEYAHDLVYDLKYKGNETGVWSTITLKHDSNSDVCTTFMYSNYFYKIKNIGTTKCKR